MASLCIRPNVLKTHNGEREAMEKCKEVEAMEKCNEVELDSNTNCIVMLCQVNSV